MTLKNLISKGYFSEELPPPFSTILLGDNIRKVFAIIKSLPALESKKLYETNFVKYSIPKVGIYRRVNGLPNPYHQLILSQSIYKNWSKIKKQFKKSKISASIPEVDKSGKRAIVQFSKFEEFKEKAIEASFDTFYEFKTDIAKYFSSIYTHSIPWAIHTKSIAKTRRRDKSLYGNNLDECVRYGQSGQTIGLPIGTDTSRIIAELIGCSIDEQLTKQLKKEGIILKGKRFVDDCHFFFYSQADAEKGLKHFQRILGDFSLNINEEKTSINKAPFSFDNSWNNQITSFSFRHVSRFQRLDLRNYFNLLINLSKKYPNDSVIKYGIKRLRKQKIHRENWNIYESLIYSLAIAEGAILPDLLAIMLQNKKYVNKIRLSSVIQSLLNQHVYQGNHFEISWSLWIAKSFNIKIPQLIAQSIIDSRDIISILILLDLRQSRLVSQRINTTDIQLEFNQDGLTNEYWLLVYEASHKGWIPSTALSTIKFFNDISVNGISFYDSTKQISIDASNVISKRTVPIKNPVKTVKKPITEEPKTTYL
jgi:hypothetical protein